MYIKLTALPDKSGEYYNVLVNAYRVIGMKEGITKDFFDKIKKDEHGYPEAYTEIITRGASFFVTQTLDEIQNLIKEAQ
jgi:predicted nucleic acid-binding Zn finger protein